MSAPAASLPRLAGPRVALVPVDRDLARAVLRDPAAAAAALRVLGLAPGRGWPHMGTADALRPLAEHGEPGDGSASWLVCLGSEVLGDCGWRGRPDADGAVELGYGLAAPARGQGTGTEAVALLAAWAEQQPGVRLVTAEVLVGNEASVRLLHRLGFVEQGSTSPYLRLVRPAPGAPRARIAGRHVC